MVGLLVFVVGYVLGANGGESAASRSPTVSSSAASARSTVSRSPAASASSTPEAAGDELADGKYFVQLNDLRGGEDGPLLIRYDLAYFYTGGQANQIAASRGDETPVPDDTYIVNDNPKLRFAPLAEDFTVRYIPEGSGSAKTVAAPQEAGVHFSGHSGPADPAVALSDARADCANHVRGFAHTTHWRSMAAARVASGSLVGVAHLGGRLGPYAPCGTADCQGRSAWRRGCGPRHWRGRGAGTQARRRRRQDR